MPKMLKSFVKAVFACYLLVCSFIWFVSPWIASQLLMPILSAENLTLAEKSTIRYNPFLSRFSVSGFDLSQIDDATHTPLVSLESAEIELGLWQLLNKTIYVSQMDIDGLKLNIDKSADEISIGGWPLPTSASNAPKNESDTQSYQDNFSIKIPDLNVVNSSIALNWHGNTHSISLSNINLNQLNLSTREQEGNIDFSLTINKSLIKLNAKFGLNNLIGEIDYKLTMNALNLADFNHFVFPNKQVNNNTLLSGLVSLTYQQKIAVNKQTIKTKLSDINLSLSDLLVRIQGANLSIKNQQLISKSLQVDIPDWQLDSARAELSGEASFNLSQLNAYTEKAQLSLANVSKLSMPKILLVTNNETHQLTLPELAIEQVNFSDNVKDDIPSLARLKSMSIYDIKLSEDGLFINNIDILGLGVDIKKTKDSELAGLIKLSTIDGNKINATSKTQPVPNKPNLDTAINEQLEKAPAKKFPIAIKVIKFQDTNQVNLIDESVQPVNKRLFNIAQLAISPIDNQKPDQVTVLTMEGSSNQYASFKFQAEAKPFSAIPYYKLSGLFKEVSLPAISSYIKDALEYEFDSGQLDLDIDVLIEDTNINGTTKIVLRGVELGATNNPNDETSSSTIPFNYALGMLKDGDGNVELEIPLQGSTTDPDFSMQGFITLLIKRATMAAAQEYLITTFVPYANIVKVSLFAGDYLLKVRFNDLPLTTGDEEIPVAALPFLEQFSALMKEKEDTDITICAYATPLDIGIDSSILKLTEIQHKQLKDLSYTRMRAFKNYMVNDQDIKSSRLLLCSPKVDKSENAQARLTFSD